MIIIIPLIIFFIWIGYNTFKKLNEFWQQKVLEVLLVLIGMALGIPVSIYIIQLL